MDFDFSSDIEFDFSDDIDFGTATNRYPCEFEHAVIDWNDHEEDLQLAALGWMRLWRKTNSFHLDEKVGYWSTPIGPDDHRVWIAMQHRMTDWAWLEKGGLDLEGIFNILIERHRIRLNEMPECELSNLLASAGNTERK